MKVIQPGVLKSTLKCRADCLYCKAIVEFVVAESTEVSDRNETGYKVNCPTVGCGHEIYFWGQPK